MESSRATRLGLFDYRHLCENWISGPYGREVIPARPVHLDQLPPSLREAVGHMRFPTLCFAETPHLQPVEHARCVSWQSAFLTADGRAIRKNVDAIGSGTAEDNYAEFYRNFIQDRELLNELTVDPPEEQNTLEGPE